ncbi:GntR family transcriptional regulator [Actinospica durhamensis]|uniref:GntR family transcriptional regulator n=1 Tax=Actinospica durhamensis TaxID=1508375 RepID=A0A941EG93_9ACTN|nr:GntR family transcriptional regulator [Actinospica durhamensis]MBR7832070.1 GntR family transcriptional regulator [Actinospica durhamensis]
MLSDSVYETIRRRLVNQEVAPGEKLNISTLAADLEVSPTPVREALARLEVEGLAVKRSLAGYTAAPLLSRRDFDDLFEMRLVVESAVAGRAATRISPADLETLDRLLEEMREARRTTNAEALRVFVDHDSLFHEQIATSSGNIMMADALRRLHAHTHLYRLYFHAGIAESTCTEHERIVDALRAADPDLAAAAMRSHLRRAQERLAPAAGGEETV